MLVACTGMVYELEPDGGAVIHAWTGPLQARSAVYTASRGVLVADLAGNTVWRMDATVSGAGTPVLNGTVPQTALSDPAGIAFAPDGTVYVANRGNDTVTEYLQPPDSPAVTPTPGRTITLPADVDSTQSVVLDARGNLYVGAFAGGVLLYPPGANGAVAPARRIVGPTSGDGTTQVALLPDRSLLVGQYAAPRVAQFSALVPLEPPGAVTGLKVTGKKTGRKRTVTWAPGPALDAAVTSYRVTVTKGSKTRLSATTTAASYTFKTKKLTKSGSYTVTVVATSATGTSPPASTTLKVKVKKNHHHHHHHHHQHRR